MSGVEHAIVVGSPLASRTITPQCGVSSIRSLAAPMASSIGRRPTPTATSWRTTAPNRSLVTTVGVTPWGAPTMRLRIASGRGQWTSVAQPRRSKHQISRADESHCPGSTPCLAERGKAWWPLCHDSPIDTTARAPTLLL